jgi:methyl-accepting chemotaxis protein
MTIQEISAASDEQSQGIGQVNSAVTQMDTMTQQNAALVEQANANAVHLEQLAGDLLSLVNRFQLEDQRTQQSRPAVAPPARPAATPRLAPTKPSAPAAPPSRKAADDQWDEF